MSVQKVKSNSIYATMPEYLKLQEARVWFDAAREAFDARVAETQAACTHVWQPVMSECEVEYTFHGRSYTPYLGRKCGRCEKFEARRLGFCWQVCHRCGCDMQEVGLIQLGMDRGHLYRCVGCGYENGHT